MNDEMQALIKRLEEATEGSRELDDDIARLCGMFVTVAFPGGQTAEVIRYRGMLCGNIVPAYTSSLDAALTLCSDEKGCTTFWRIGHDGEGADPSLFKAETLYCGQLRTVRGVGISWTAPLALCIAALKARQAKDSA